MITKDIWKKHSHAICIVALLVLLPLILFLIRPSSEEQKQPRQKTPVAQPQWQTYDELVKEGKLAPAGKILEVVLHYSQGSKSQLNLASVTRMNGYAPNVLPHDNQYRLQLLTANGRVRTEQPFGIPIEQNNETLHADGVITGKISQSTSISVVVTVDWQDDISGARVVNASGKELLAVDLSLVRDLDNKPEFRSIQGEELLGVQAQKQKSNVFIIPNPAHAQTIPGGKVRILLIGDNFTDMNLYRSNVDNITKNFILVEPYKSRTSQLTFSSIDNTDDLKCSTSGVADCDDAVVTARANRAGVPYDFIGVVVDGPFGGTAGGIVAAIGNRGANNIISDAVYGVALHELGGHIIGTLADEYTVYDGEVGPDYKRIEKGNCYAGNTPPAAAWNALNPPIALSEYRANCLYENWYASSKNSVMNHISLALKDNCFNAVSQRIINSKMDALVGKLPSGDLPLFPCPAVVPTVQPPSPVPTTIVTQPISPSTPVPTYVCGGSTDNTCITPTSRPTMIPPASPTQNVVSPTDVEVLPTEADILPTISLNPNPGNPGEPSQQPEYGPIWQFILLFFGFFLRLLLLIVGI